MNIIDITCIVLALLFLFFGFRRGFASVLLRFIANLLSAFIARFAALPAATYLYTAFVHAPVQTKLFELFPSGSVEGNIAAIIDSAKESVPDSAYKIADYFQMFTDELLDPDKVHTVAQLESAYVQPILTKVIVIITTVGLFLVLSVILGLIANMINKHFFENKDGKLGTVNKVLGGVFGLARGMIPIAAGCMILNVLASLADQSAFSMLVQNSVVCDFIAGRF